MRQTCIVIKVPSLLSVTPLCLQLNVPLIGNTDLSMFGIKHKTPGFPILEGLPNIPHFPVLWIDLGADVESVSVPDSTTRGH